MADSTRPPIDRQTDFWNVWNTEHLEAAELDPATLRRRDAVLALLPRCGLESPRILEVGCATGWLTEQLARFGPATGTDLAGEVIERAQERAPHIEFLAGDFLELDLSAGAYDIVVSLETIAHVPDQKRFVERVADLLAPRGHFVLTTQNRFVMERSDVPPPGEGQLRDWLDFRRVKRLLAPRFEILHLTSVNPPRGHGGVLRLVNSCKLNAILAAVASRQLLERLKCRAGLGETIVALARRRD